MALPQIDPTNTSAWKKLEKHYKTVHKDHMNDWFKANPNRAEEFQIRWQNFLIDYSKNRITAETKEILLELASEMQLKQAIAQQFTGHKINETEHRAVLHTALRRQDKPKEVTQTLKKMKKFSDQLITGKWKGFSDKNITDVVNIGIGGSDLGPRMAVEALQYYRNHLKMHFVSNVDGDQAAELCRDLNPETTLFIVVSKSFSTQETLNNAKYFRRWFLKVGPRKGMSKHFVGVSSNIEAANKFGIIKKNIFPMWDWVGGRFSLWSAVGLSVCCAIGYTHFKALLNGAQRMDTHFKEADFSDNIPVMLGLLSVWYNNFFKAETEAIVPYSQYLERLVPYLQQAVMESNGKSVSRNGEKLTYQTGTVIWGSTGTNAQHAFFQLLHQGTKLIPCDFIGFKHALHGNKNSQDKLMANFFAQTEALLKGKTQAEAKAELQNMPAEKQNKLLPFKLFEGNKPTTTILIDQLTPESLGSLLALYEHKIFVQGVIWNIFSYDQWGVELGKQLASDILKEIKNKATAKHDSSTQGLLEYYKQDP